MYICDYSDILLSSFIFLKKQAITLNRLSVCLKFSLLMLAFVWLVSRDPLLLNNFLIVVLSTFAFGFVTLQRYLEYKHDELELQDIERLSDKSEAILYTHLLIKTFLK